MSSKSMAMDDAQWQTMVEGFRDGNPPFNPILLKGVRALRLHINACDIMAQHHFPYIGDLVTMDLEVLIKSMATRGGGFDDVKTTVGAAGLSLGMKIPQWPYCGLTYRNRISELVAADR